MSLFSKDLVLIRKKMLLSKQDVFYKCRIPIETIDTMEDGSIFSGKMKNTTYIRSYFRTYAKAIGIKEEDIVKALEEHKNNSYQGSLAKKYLSSEESASEKTEEKSSGLKKKKRKDPPEEEKKSRKKIITPEFQEKNISDIEWEDQNFKKVRSTSTTFFSSAEGHKPESVEKSYAAPPDPGSVDWASRVKKAVYRPQKNRLLWVIIATLLALSLALASAYWFWNNSTPLSTSRTGEALISESHSEEPGTDMEEGTNSREQASQGLAATPSPSQRSVSETEASVSERAETPPATRQPAEEPPPSEPPVSPPIQPEEEEEPSSPPPQDTQEEQLHPGESVYPQEEADTTSLPSPSSTEEDTLSPEPSIPADPQEEADTTSLPSPSSTEEDTLRREPSIPADPQEEADATSLPSPSSTEEDTLRREPSIPADPQEEADADALPDTLQDNREQIEADTLSAHSDLSAEQDSVRSVQEQNKAVSALKALVSNSIIDSTEDDTLHVIVYALYGSLEPIRIHSDIFASETSQNLNLQSFRLAHLEAKRFSFKDHILFQGPLSRMILIFNGNIIDDFRDYYDDGPRIRLSREQLLHRGRFDTPDSELFAKIPDPAKVFDRREYAN